MNADLLLKRVERDHPYRYIGVHDHRFGGQSLGYGLGASRRWRGDWLRSLVDEVGFEPTEPLRPWKPRGSPECKSGALSLSAIRPHRLDQTRPAQPARAFQSECPRLGTFLCSHNKNHALATKMCRDGLISLL